jgi:hypothetical protein
MINDSIKFRVVQNPISKNITLEIYRPYGIDNDWMRVDSFNEMTVQELKYLTEYLIKLFKTKSSN